MTQPPPHQQHYHHVDIMGEEQPLAHHHVIVVVLIFNVFFLFAFLLRKSFSYRRRASSPGGFLFYYFVCCCCVLLRLLPLLKQAIWFWEGFSHAHLLFTIIVIQQEYYVYLLLWLFSRLIPREVFNVSIWLLVRSFFIVLLLPSLFLVRCVFVSACLLVCC